MTDVDTPLRVLSLCSGIGGLDLGIRRALHARVVAYVERDPFCASVLLGRMEDEALDPAPVWCGDLRELDLRPLAGSIDLVCGGYPCQPFSHAGSRKGADDERHLWPAIRDTLRVVRPRFAFFENVAGHLRLGFDVVLSDLASLGFDARWGLVRASDVGAPHRRERLFICAWDRDLDSSECGRWLREGVVNPDLGGGSCGLQQPQRTHPRGDGEGVADALRGNESQERAGDGEVGEQRSPVRGGAEQLAGAGTGSGDPGGAVAEGGSQRSMADAECEDLSGRGRPHDLAGSSGRTEEEGLQQQRRRDAADDRESAVADADSRGSQGGGVEEHPKLKGEQRRVSHGCSGERELGGPTVADAQGADGRSGERPTQAGTGAPRERGGRSTGRELRSASPRTDAGVDAVPGLRELPVQYPRDPRPRVPVSLDRGVGPQPLPAFPPGPGDNWGSIPEFLHPALGEAPTQPDLRGVADGLSDLVDAAQRYRTDRLRALGNSVVPAQAERAVRLLWPTLE